ncbi:DUF72 domain-containing protein [Treponema primitia]|uniref:DUF72 domain-containing protein n=1 Tax=Treponema primitia TaxID=88058 RepID=UPI003981920C
MTQIEIGTCGYHYTDWIGPVYPEGTPKTDYLRLYAGRFPTVELDYAYYTMPTAAQLANMLETGPELTFSIKAHETLTHKVNPDTWEGDARTYREALKPLLQARRLGAVLFQFPYSFHYEPDQRRYLDKVLSFFADVPLAVEFRNAEWINNRVIDALRNRNAALVSLDMPELKGLPPALDTVTAPLAYLRFHGRNGETWWGSDAAARYDYLYTEAELETWAGRIKQIAVKADRVLVYFNNHWRGQAVRNGEMLIAILQRAGLLG